MVQLETKQNEQGQPHAPRQKLQRWPLFGTGITLYGLALLLNWWLTEGKAGRVGQIGLGVILFWLIYWFAGRSRRAYWLGLIALVVLALVSLLSLPTLTDTDIRANAISDRIWDKVDQLLPKIKALAMNRNALAGLLDIVATLALAYALFRQRGWAGRLTGALVAGLMFGLLLITNSRGGLGALGAGILLLGLLSWRYLQPKLRIALAGGLVGLVGLAGLYLFVSGQYRFFTPTMLLYGTGTGRLEIWRRTLYFLAELPLTGPGPGRFDPVYSFYNDPANPPGFFYQEHAHNLFLQTYVELGLPGLLALVVVTGQWAWLCWQIAGPKSTAFAYHSETFRRNRAPLLGGLAAYGALLFYGLSEHTTWNRQFTPLFWLPLALVTAALPLKEANHFGKLGQVWAKGQAWLAKRKVLAVGGGLAGLALVAGLGWLGSGLAQVNAASLEKLKAWEKQDFSGLSQIERLYQQAPTSNVQSRGLGWVKFMQGQDSEAEAYLKEAVQLDPKDQPSLLLLGDLAERQGRHSEALAWWEKGSAGPIYVGRGQRFTDLGYWDHAESALRQAKEIDPAQWKLYIALATLYERTKQPAKVQAALEEGLQTLPGEWHIYSRLEQFKEQEAR